MLFNSLHYLIFLPIVVSLYFLLGFKSRKWFLLAASYYFYMVFSVPFILLMVWSTFLDFFVAKKIHTTEDKKKKKRFLLISVVSNLGLLFFFKYFNLTAYSLGVLLGGEPHSWVIESILLPMGISFYTFQTISYTIDVYRGQLKPTDSLLDMALYVSFFPQLVAGPIMRGQTFMPQFTEKFYPDANRMLSGLLLIMWGLSKKVFVADPIGRYADAVFGKSVTLWGGESIGLDPASFSGLTLLLGTYAFAIQIYCDFSAYTDIARGSGRLLGFRLMENFKEPYLSTSIQDFWRRWHISLSSWLKDYLYIPLGGNRKGTFRTYINLMLTMLLGGLWHGANWTFLIWGGLHGGYLAFERAFLKPSSPDRSSIGVKILKGFIVFQLVCLAWIFFRSSTASQAFIMVQGIVTWQSGINYSITPLLILLAMLLYQSVKYKISLNSLLLQKPVYGRWLCYGVLLLVIIVLMGSPSPEFIYFQF